MSEYKKNRLKLIERTSERLREKGERTRDYSTNPDQKSRGNKYFKLASKLENIKVKDSPVKKMDSKEYLKNRASVSDKVEKRLLDSQAAQRKREGSYLNGRSGPVNQNLMKRAHDMNKVGKRSRSYLRIIKAGSRGGGAGAGMFKDSMKIKK